MIPIYICLLPVIIILLIILIVLLYIRFLYVGDKKTLSDITSMVIGGGNKLLKNNKYKVNYPKYITIRSLLKEDFYVLPITDSEFSDNTNEDDINYPKIDIIFKKYNSKEYCFEIYRLSKKKIIFSDIIKYEDEDIRDKDFNQRMKLLEKACKEMNLLKFDYKFFNHNNHFGNQFKEIFDNNKPLIIIFKSPSKNYYKYGSTYKWVDKTILTIYGNIVKNKFMIDDFELKNNEFPLNKFINKYNKKTKVKLFIKDGKPEIEIDKSHISKIQNDSLIQYNIVKDTWIQMNKGLILDSFLGNTLEVLKRLHRNIAEEKLFNNIEVEEYEIDNKLYYSDGNIIYENTKVKSRSVLKIKIYHI